jgi:hypothetical protein
MAKKGEVKHNKKELDKRALASKLKNGGAGGGKADAEKRKEKTLKCLIKCSICMVRNTLQPACRHTHNYTALTAFRSYLQGMQPNVHSMGIHYEAKHSKIKWEDVKAGYETMAAGGV